MSQSNIYNLRKRYNSKKNDEKDQSDSKSKVYTFYEGQINQKDFVEQDSHKKSCFAYQKSFKGNFLNHSDKQNTKEKVLTKYRENKDHRQSIPSQLNRYLKEYQYNCYKLEENHLSNTKAQRKKAQDCFSSDKKLGIKQRYEIPDSSLILSSLQAHNRSHNILNRSLNCSNQHLKENSLNSFIVQNIGKNKSPQLQAQIHSFPSKALTFNDTIPQARRQPVCSRQELALIKMMKVQIDELKDEIQEKNVHISALQVKLQKHLIERIEIQKDIEKNTLILENKIHILQFQNHQIHKKLIHNEKQSDYWKNLCQKMHIPFSDAHPFNKTVFQPNSIIPSQEFSSILSDVSELDIYKKLIIKIDQMKNKIESSHNFGSSEEFNNSRKFIHEEINLKNLWKWLKKIGKEYEVIKQKVSAYENASMIQMKRNT